MYGLIYTEKGYWVNFIDPVLFEIGDIAVTPIFIEYLALPFMLFFFLRYLTRKNLTTLTLKQNLVFTAVMVGCVYFGGTFGEILFWKKTPLFEDPERLLRVWDAGRSFHGALIFGIVGCLISGRIFKISSLHLMDICVMLIAPALFIGRICNFINSSLVGRTTDMPWAVVFPSYDLLPRHPSALYEALGEGLLLTIILWRKRADLLKKPGLQASRFLFFYGVIRFVLEFFRFPDGDWGLFLNTFTTGQLLCLPMILIGGAGLLAQNSRAGVKIP